MKWLAVVAVVGLAVLGGVAFALWASGTTSAGVSAPFEVSEGTPTPTPVPNQMYYCPVAGKWSIAVWEGGNATSIIEAVGTCGDDAIEAAYRLDPDTQAWSRWFRRAPEISNLETLDTRQGVLALGGVGAVAAGGPASWDQQDERIQDCPRAGQWAISVWSGNNGTDAGEALETCGAGATAVAYHLDPETQRWLRWFASRPDLSNLETLNAAQGVIALGSTTGPVQTPTPTPTPEPDNGFSEEYPAWNMPDLAVVSLTVEPDRADPGDSINLRALVSNLGTGDAMSATLILTVDDTEISRAAVDALLPLGEAEIRATWVADEPGRHQVFAELEASADRFDRDHDNDRQAATVRISGEADPEPELELDTNLDELDLIPGEPVTITLSVRNPSFADVVNVPLEFYIDGELVSDEYLEYLAPGGQQQFEFRWLEVTSGQHRVVLRMLLPDDFPDAELQSVKSWDVAVPESTVLYDTFQTGKWVSIGPRILTKGWPDGSVGVMYHIAFHPTDPMIVYAGAPTGGLWKTINGGQSWQPLTDKLPPRFIGAVAVDPGDGNIVYFSTGSSYFGGCIGIYKSIDGGINWDLFAAKAQDPTAGELPIGGASKLVIRRPSPGQVLIYAASDVGVLRYRSNDPKAKQSNASDWAVIESGKIPDMAVHPTNNSIVYISVAQKGLYRTVKGETAAGEGDWNKLADPVAITSSTGPYYTLDVYWDNPRTIYAAIKNPDSNHTLGLYHSTDEGSSWPDSHLSTGDGLYNPFIRVSPVQRDLVYYGGVKLYKYSRAWGPSAEPVRIDGIHDDMHGMEWDPFDSNKYYILGDGGIWRCEVGGFAAKDSCVHRNNDLRVTQFHDFDASRTDSQLMLGGTQDNGTMLYEGKPDWRSLSIFNYGDGYYSLIASKDNKTMYAQFQALDSTARSADGGKTWQKANNGLPKGWSMGSGYITAHPNDPSGQTLLSAGDQVYRTDDGGKNWKGIGPSGGNVKGHVTRVVVQPQTWTLIAGTSEGQIWYSSTGGVGTWSLMWDVSPYKAAVASMAFAPTDHKVLYVTYGGGVPAHMRIWRLEYAPGPPGFWSATGPQFESFPANRTPTVIAGDGHSAGVAYVGTDRGVYRCATGEPTWDNCKEYNVGLPLVEIKDLLVDPVSKQLRAATWGRGAWSVITGP